jgi:hypothetical protein
MTSKPSRCIYLACGLTHVPQRHFNRYVQSMHDAIAAVENTLHCTARYALRDSDPELAEHPQQSRAHLCYTWDRDMVLEADLVIADVTFPSIGVGIELGLAASQDIPIVLTYCCDLAPRAGHKLYGLPGSASTQALQVGEGFVTLMALGLPTLIQVNVYHAPEDYAAVVLTSVGEIWSTP